jgi:hypothetical protein
MFTFTRSSSPSHPHTLTPSHPHTLTPSQPHTLSPSHPLTLSLSHQFPIISTVLAPLNPLIQLYFTVPFASLASFFAIYLLVVNNFEWDRNVRFNAMQAILLDIILIFPGLIESVLKLRPVGGLGLQLYIQVYNAIFLFVLVAVVYAVGSSIVGSTARIPLVADAADAQTR